MTDDLSCNKEREVQDVGDRDDNIIYKLLLDVETLMDEDNFEIETESQGRLRGVEQKDPSLGDEGKLVARERLGTSGKEKVYRRTLVPQAGHCYDDRTGLSFASLSGSVNQ